MVYQAGGPLKTRKPKRKGEQEDGSDEADEAQALIAEWEAKALERNVQTLRSLPQAVEQAAASARAKQAPDKRRAESDDPGGGRRGAGPQRLVDGGAARA